MEKILYVVFAFGLFFQQTIYPLLDGRTTPIVLDTRYSFTNFELARGFVHFRNGFDLPPGGTVILQLDGNCPVFNAIYLNGGTLIINNELTLGSNVRIQGNGFLIGQPQSSSQATIFFQTFFTYTAGNYIKISNSLSFKSSTWGMIDFLSGSVLDARGADFLGFTHCSLIVRGNSIMMPEGSLSKLYFSDCNIFPGSGQATVFATPTVYFQGKNLISVVSKGFQLKNISLVNHGSLEIGSGSNVTLSGISMQESGSSLVLNDTNLDFVATTTEQIRIGTTGPSAKTSILFNGENIFSSSTGNQIVIPSNLKMEFLPGSRLIVSNDFHLIIE